MHERERWQAILAQVAGRSVVTVAELVETTGASGATIRRDLGRMAEEGLVRRVHGGVEAIDQLPSGVLGTRAFDVSSALHSEVKRAIAERAVSMCHDGESIIINGGTTTFQMVEALKRRTLSILTNSYPMAHALITGSDNRIVLPGGEVYRKQGIIVSPFDDDAIQHYAASKMFMCCSSIGPMGVIEGDPLIARAETKLLRRSDKLIVMVDSSKFETRGSIVVCPLKRVSTVITDDNAPPAALEFLEAAGVEVILVKAERRAAASAA